MLFSRLIYAMHNHLFYLQNPNKQNRYSSRTAHRKSDKKWEAATNQKYSESGHTCLMFISTSLILLKCQPHFVVVQLLYLLTYILWPYYRKTLLKRI